MSTISSLRLRIFQILLGALSSFSAQQRQPPVWKRSPGFLLFFHQVLLTWFQGISSSLFYLNHVIILQPSKETVRGGKTNRGSLFHIIKGLTGGRYDIPVSCSFSCSSLCRRIIEFNWSLFHFFSLPLMWVLAQVEWNISGLKGDYFYKLNQCILLSSISRNVTLLYFIIKDGSNKDVLANMPSNNACWIWIKFAGDH